jgi:DNA-binding CsgD family transcriptional regulator
LSPLQYDSPSEWRAATHGAIRALFDADQAMTIMAGAGEIVESQDFDTTTLRSIRRWFDGFTDEGRLTLNDPVVNHWNDRRRELGIRVYSRDVIDHAIGGRVINSPYVNEALFTNGMRFWQGAYAAGVQGSDAILWVSYSRPDAEPFGGDALRLLSLLAPAFQAGVDVLTRLRGSAATLDSVNQPILVFDRTGKELHRTAAFGGAVSAEREVAAVVARARVLAKEVAAASISALAVAEVEVGGRHYSLRATILPEQTFCAGPAFAVLVRSSSLVLPEVAVLQGRHGLTRREAEVARRVAAGETRDEIAAALGVTAHTVRTHTEHLFQKLGVHNRTEAAVRILEGAPR